MNSTKFLDKIFKEMDKRQIKEKNKIRERDKSFFLSHCKNYSYIPTIIKPQKRIIAIGDVHGGYDLTIDVLKIAKVIDDDLNWIGGETYIVQCGDQIDSCRPNEYKCDHPKATENDKPDDKKILNFFTDLNIKAIKHGGRVLSLLGNHEIMNVMGNINYVSYENLKSVGSPESSKSLIESGKENRRKMFEPGSEYGKFLGCTRIPIIIIGDFLFVHGGIVPAFNKMLKIKNRYDLYKLNYAIRKWLLDLDMEEINKESMSSIINGTDNSMFWNRILGGLPTDVNKDDPKYNEDCVNPKYCYQNCVDYLDPILKIFKVKNMIIGHTPQYFHNKIGINSTCDKRVWRVDVGSSHAFNKFDEEYDKKKYNKTGVITSLRKAQVLEIKNNSIVKILM